MRKFLGTGLLGPSNGHNFVQVDPILENSTFSESLYIKLQHLYFMVDIRRGRVQVQKRCQSKG